ncbi:Protein SVP26 [Golovinomyces cichoracearum]|uniref:Protein SVP26 n=1 Tax=Golovinomyces cichoracearum TaxID=62708 RepID=A0A420IW96_9PEZI|nr:Protein SVP26 [Golovinomyces cichoracearum]
MWILPLLGYTGFAVGFGFLTLSIASGLYYLSELVEEYTVIAKKLLTYMIYLVIGFQVLLFLIDGFPFLLSALGVFTHIVYLGNLRRFPMVQISDPLFILSCVMVVINHYLWFSHFSSLSLVFAPKSRFDSLQVPTFVETSSFFGICVWLIPFSLFVSLSASDNVLPTMGSAMPSIPNTAGKHKRQGMIKYIVDTSRERFADLGLLLGCRVPEREL